MSIKIISWNIWGGKHLPEVIDFLKKADADIVGLQEVLQNIDGTNNIAKIIADELGYEWVYGVASLLTEKSQLLQTLQKTDKTMEWGNAILSRHKIIGNKVHTLSETRKRIAVEVIIKLKNKNLHIFNTHLVHTHQQLSEVQDSQVENLLKIIPKGNTIIMGDFNATPESNAIKIMSTVMKNTDEDPTHLSWSVYPEGCPTCNPVGIIHRLDYIFTSEDVKTLLSTVKNSKASDHLPISAILDV